MKSGYTTGKYSKLKHFPNGNLSSFNDSDINQCSLLFIFKLGYHPKMVGNFQEKTLWKRLVDGRVKSTNHRRIYGLIVAFGR